jgi:hypothetical protein
MAYAQEIPCSYRILNLFPHKPAILPDNDPFHSISQNQNVSSEDSC